MPITKSSSPRYYAPARFTELSESGSLVTALFDCQFKRLKLSQLQQLQADVSTWSEMAMAAMRKRAADVAAAAAAVATAEPVPADTQAPLEQPPAIEEMVNRKLLERVMSGWRAVQGDDGADLPYSQAALDAMEEDKPGFINACAEAFWQSLQPKEAAHLAQKN